MSLNKMTVANRYARAMFELVDAQGQLDQTYEELTNLRQVFLDNPTLASLLSGVNLSLKEKESLLQVLKQDASQPVTNLIQMVFDYGRMDTLVAIINEFERRYDLKYKRVHADVVTAVQLDETRRNQLKANLAERLGANEVLLSEKVDPAIIGGVIVQTENQTMDGSIATQIEQVRRLLLN
ncbi:H(+)-transporting ATPase F(1) delta subunit [Limosilactobacillus gastricus PS3]|uniref:ATP synthase subunit delta n=2 Tax=Limosilactobacillus gastricus TaxID=227942 RepID=H4GJ33_9LACO|nr:ATP synthase F1 subunit delta [Limosilactobacillus gastricus]EHS87058.1 H(+)-transporting ATPase F(1) delta subunit [Limosilactobacillus gastricus PS3]KRM03437.1 H(+)-transporting ATPase F(1) delta subunit [Limosilactobacillus gastricus DSM 16045]QGF40856.1 F0F1 ATP synthase subunit delta [Limosilactobacillus gastricus]